MEHMYCGRIAIDYDRDENFSAQALKLLTDYYMLPDESSPQEAFARAALAYCEGDYGFAQRIYDYASKRWFMFASPVLSNAPLDGVEPKGLPISCFLTYVGDNLESLISHNAEVAWLSVKGGGVGGHWSDVRGISDKAPGPIPFMKVVDSGMTAWKQGRTRKGSYAAYMDVSHPDIIEFINFKVPTGDTNRKCFNLFNAVNITDAFMEAVEHGTEWQLRDPNDGDVRDSIPARDLWERILEARFRTGSPYLHFIDESNRRLPDSQKALGLAVRGSNLCSEILQVNTPTTYNEDLSYNQVGKDISCNLGSLNIAKTMDSPNFPLTVEAAIRALTAVSDLSNIASVTSIKEGNDQSHAIGLGQMNLHGYLARERIHYGSDEGVDFTNIYFYTILFHALTASNKIAKERNKTFVGFEKSKYASGEFFKKYVEKEWKPKTARVAQLFTESNIAIPTQDDWKALSEEIKQHGIYNQNLQAVPPTGSISYINNSTSSIHPVASKIEIRKEGKLGRVYYPAPYLTNDNLEYYADAYEIGPEKIIATYAAATQHVDQGLSLTLFFKDTATTRDINKAQITAWKAGIKTIYYIRIRQMALEGTEVSDCVSCML